MVLRCVISHDRINFIFLICIIFGFLGLFCGSNEFCLLFVPNNNIKIIYVVIILMMNEVHDLGVDYDEVVVNLKVIASITINSKLYTKGSLLNLEQPSVVPESLRRWYRQDSRDDAIKKIERIVCKSFTYLPKEKLVVKYLTDAKSGILNMKETYSGCVQTGARLDAILDKIESTVKV